jgi:antitoxin component YwqK of YwqJK toxin-antitoxin module
LKFESAGRALGTVAAVALVSTLLGFVMADAPAMTELRPHATVTSRFSDGHVRRIAEYHDGVLDGTARGWYENGAQMYQYTYRDGLYEGRAIQWFPNGQKYTEQNYAKGYEAGLQRMWNEDGTLRANYAARDGRHYGLMGSTGCTGKHK